MLARIFFLLVASLVGFNAAAQYPSRPIHLIVPIPPGGPPDIPARVPAQKPAGRMGEPGVVENGAAPTGNIPPGLVPPPPPTGQTLALFADGRTPTTPHL